MAADFRHECHDGQNDSGIDDDKPAFYAGEANETDILAEGDVQGAQLEEGGKGGAEAIANIAAAQLPVRRETVLHGEGDAVVQPTNSIIEAK